MESMTIARSASGGGKSFSGGRSVSATSHIASSPSVAAAKAGTLTTRTSGTAGTLTMAAGHGIPTGATIDIYWSGGQCTSATVGTVSGNSVPFTTATGDALPLATTVIAAMVQVTESMAFLAANLVALAVGAGNLAVPAPTAAQAACSATLRKADGSVAGVVRVAAGVGQHYIWDSLNGVTNPVGSNDVASVSVTHGDIASAQVVNIVAMVN